MGTITELIAEAWVEVKAARSCGDVDSERLWVDALDCLLDRYSRFVAGEG